jgi:hypothetical protein
VIVEIDDPGGLRTEQHASGHAVVKRRTPTVVGDRPLASFPTEM